MKKTFIIIILILTSIFVSYSQSEYKLEIKKASFDQTDECNVIYYIDNKSIYVSEMTEITNTDIKKGKIVKDKATNRDNLFITLNDEATIKFKELTEGWISKPLVVMINDEIISYPIVMEQIHSGQMIIYNNYSLDKLKEIVKYLNKRK